MWQRARMEANDSPVTVHRTVVEALTIDAMVLADEIESYFGGDKLEAALPAMDAARQGAVARVGLKAATRINRLVEWLVQSEMSALKPPESVVPAEPLWTEDDARRLPPTARALAEATTDLFERAGRMHDPALGVPMVSPARALQDRIAAEMGLRRA